MGIDIYEARFLLECRQRGVNFSRAMMIGRQTLCLSAKSLSYVMTRMGYPKSLDEIARATMQPAPYRYPFAEKFFLMLGASHVESIDRSGYEGASILADLAGEIPDELKGAFTAVIDCGTLEHIFDAQAGMRNCMSLVARGGHYLGILPCNNNMGHGFYQFSPEFFFRLLAPDNGFCIEKLYLCERAGLPQFRNVPDPAQVGRRIELRNSRSTYLMVCAQRVEDQISRKSEILQSDYVAAWEENVLAGVPSMRDRIAFMLKKHLPPVAFETIRHFAGAGDMSSSWRKLKRASWS